MRYIFTTNVLLILSDLVVKQLKQKTEEGNSGDANESIDELLQKVKDMALNIKKVDKTDE